MDMRSTRVALGVALISISSIGWGANPDFHPDASGFIAAALTPSKPRLLSEGAAAGAACLYRARLAYEVANFRAGGGKREFFKLHFSDSADPELKAQTLQAVDLAFEAQGSPEEVAALVYHDCIGTRT